MSVQQMDVRANVPTVLLIAISRTAERAWAEQKHAVWGQIMPIIQ